MIRLNQIVCHPDYSISLDTYWYGYPESKIEVKWKEVGGVEKVFHIRVGYEHGHLAYKCKHDLSLRLQEVLRLNYRIGKSATELTGNRH